MATLFLALNWLLKLFITLGALSFFVFFCVYCAFLYGSRGD